MTTRRPPLARPSLLAPLLVAFAACSSAEDGTGATRAAPGAGADGGGASGGGDSGGPTSTDGGGTPASPDASTGTTGSDASAPADAGDAATKAGRDLSTDRNAFFGASRCAGLHAQLCEDFETGTLDKATWEVAGDVPVIDSVHTARGGKALHITKVGNGLSYIRERKTFPEANNGYFGRAFVYFASLPATPSMTYAHWTFLAASGTGTTGEIRVSGQLQNGANHLGVGTDSGNDPAGTGDWTNSDNDPAGKPRAVPLGEWMCIEWQHDGAANETRLWWDAVEHVSLHTTAKLHGGNKNDYVLPAMNNVWIGWQEYQTSGDKFEMWVDEIAIDKARIGCVD